MSRILWVVAAVSLVSLVLCITNDVVFVIDTSGSLNQTDLNYSIDFLYDVTEYLTIGASDVQVSIVTFSNVSIVQHTFSALPTKSDVLNALQSLKSITTAGGTKTYLALDDSYDLLVTSGTSGRRAGVNKTVVVLTDGKSDNLLNTRTAAERLQTEGIEVFSVGVGSEVVDDKTELYAIASDPDSYYQHDIEFFIHLCNVVPTLAVKLDPSIGTITLPPDCVTTTTTTAAPKKKPPATTTEAPTTSTTQATTTADTTTVIATTETSAATTETTEATTTVTVDTTTVAGATTTATTAAGGATTTAAAGGATTTAATPQSQASAATDDSTTSAPIIGVGAAASLLLLSSIPGGYFIYRAALRRKIRNDEKEEEVQEAIQPYEQSEPKPIGPAKRAWQA